jgi:hypothetical protein
MDSTPGSARDKAPVVLGPMLRYVDETTASIWLETREAGTVVVRCGQRSWQARTFGVHGHHYALVELDGLEPGSRQAYEVEIGGRRVWPEDDGFPPPVIATLDPARRLHLVFGSCRTSVPHDAAGNRLHGVDAMRAYGLAAAGRGGLRPERLPDLALLLGDQVYADSTSRQMKDFIASRRSLKEPPGEELKDYEEYSYLYYLAWSDPTNRWLLSTLPTAMIFDDHDIRDDWNASYDWKREIEKTSWWHGRIVSGLASYWVYQHLGNLSPAERATDEIWQVVTRHSGEEELDIGPVLDAFADRVDREPETYRFSFLRDFGDIRLVVVDSRAARELEPSERALLDRHEMDWLDGALHGEFRHLLIGTSLPFLLPPGLHHVESWNEAVSHGKWGRAAGWFGEKLRQALDLEHWAAFQRSFQEVAEMVQQVADGRRGPAPETVTFLSGDVHFSYVAEVERDAGSRILQAVCSPVRNPLPRALRFFSAAMAYGPAAVLGHQVAKSAKVPDPPFAWHGIKGPWFENNLATLEDTAEGLRLRWDTGVVHRGHHDHPRLETVSAFTLHPRGAAELDEIE